MYPAGTAMTSSTTATTGSEPPLAGVISAAGTTIVPGAASGGPPVAPAHDASSPRRRPLGGRVTTAGAPSAWPPAREPDPGLGGRPASAEVVPGGGWYVVDASGIVFGATGGSGVGVSARALLSAPALAIEGGGGTGGVTVGGNCTWASPGSVPAPHRVNVVPLMSVVSGGGEASVSPAAVDSPGGSPPGPEAASAVVTGGFAGMTPIAAGISIVPATIERAAVSGGTEKVSTVVSSVEDGGGGGDAATASAGITDEDDEGRRRPETSGDAAGDGWGVWTPVDAGDWATGRRGRGGGRGVIDTPIGTGREPAGTAKGRE